MTQVFVRGVPAQAVQQFWPLALPYIKRALEHTHGEVLPADLLARCLERDIQLWLISREKRIFGAATTEIVVYPQRKHCRIITIAGSDFDSWSGNAADQIEEWAREQGCDGMEAFVRKGFVGKLQQLGYRHKQSVVIKELQK